MSFRYRILLVVSALLVAGVGSAVAATKKNTSAPRAMSCGAGPAPDEFYHVSDPAEKAKLKKDLEHESSKVFNSGRSLEKLHASGAPTGSLLNKTNALAKARKELALKTWYADPSAAYGHAFLPSVQISLKKFLPGCIETSATVEGKLKIVHADDFVNGQSYESYTLTTKNGKKYRLHPAGRFHAPVTSGLIVKIKGYQLDNEILFEASSAKNFVIVPKKSSIIVPAASANVPDAMGPQSTIVIMVNFADTTSTLTQPQVNDYVFNQVNAYHQENSYGKTSLVGQTLGWYQITLNNTCNYDAIANAAIAAADADVYFPDYSRLVVIAPFNTCGYSGIATFGKTDVATADGVVSMSKAWISAPYISIGTIAHEIGHNFSLQHAHFLNCGAVVVSSTGCTTVEYGDQFDVMGNSAGRHHMNSAHKDYVGWLDAGTVHEVTASGTFTLVPMENNSPSTMALKLRRGPYASNYLWAEYRQPIGTDASTTYPDMWEGALVHIDQGNGHTAILDVTPPGNSQTPALHVGGSFTDPLTGSVLQVTDKTPTALTLAVSTGKIDFTPPQVTITAPADSATVAGTVFVSANAFATSGIDHVTFFMSGTSVTDYSAPYETSWDTTQTANGTQMIIASVVDSSGAPYNVPGNEANTNIFVTVANEDAVPPSTSIVAPTQNQILSNPITFTADASDNNGIFEVELWRDNDLYPFYTLWFPPYTSGPVTLPEGTHTVWSVAKDYVGNLTNSAIVNFTVGETEPPAIAWIQPANGATVSGIVTVSASASDNVGVIKVEFYVDGALHATATSSPYSATWDTASLPPQSSHSLYAKAYDAVGNTAATTPVSVTIIDTAPPATAITFPTTGSTVLRNSTVTIQASASDNVGVTQVEFRVNNILKCTDTAAPYSCAWLVPPQKNINYSLQSKAFDASGNSASSAIVSVRSR